MHQRGLSRLASDSSHGGSGAGPRVGEGPGRHPDRRHTEARGVRNVVRPCLRRQLLRRLPRPLHAAWCVHSEQTMSDPHVLLSCRHKFCR